MSKPRVGRLLTGRETRDAIHVPIMPIQAGEKLFRGDRVQILGGRAIKTPLEEKMVGIVDPFLLIDHIYPEEWFYLFLRPESTSRLWHDWTHPLVDGRRPPK